MLRLAVTQFVTQALRRGLPRQNGVTPPPEVGYPAWKAVPTAPLGASLGGQAVSGGTVVDRCQWHANGTRGVLACRRTGYPHPLVTHHHPGPVVEPSRSEARRRRLYLVGCLGISLPCQCVASYLHEYPAMKVSGCPLLTGLNSTWTARPVGRGDPCPGCRRAAGDLTLSGLVRWW